MAKATSGQPGNFNNDWQSLVAKQETKNNKTQQSDEPDPFYKKREDTYYGLFPSDAGEKYGFAVVPAANGAPFVLADVGTIKMHRFTSPKDGQHYFETMKLIMDPNMLFDMSVMSRISDPNSISEEDKELLKKIKRHANLVQRYKDLQYCREEGVNYGYSPKPGLFVNRLKKVTLTAFFGRWTKWKGAVNTHGDKSVKLIYSTHAQFQEKFRAVLKTMGESHDELQPTWFEDYFSTNGGVKGILDVNMGSMKVGGNGCTVKLIKVGKDPIDDKSVGFLAPIEEKDLVFPEGEDNALSHLHFYMGYASNEDLYQEVYMDRVERAISQLEDNLTSQRLKNAGSTASVVGNAEEVNSTQVKTDGAAKSSSEPF